MLSLRDRYFIPRAPDGREVVELRAFTHGLMPRTVPAMMEAFVTDWRERGVDAWNDVPDHWGMASTEAPGWWTLPEQLGDAFVAPLLGAPAGTCIHQPHVHWTVSCLLSCDEPFHGGRTEVLCSELDFPSVLHAVQRWAPLRQLSPRVVPPDGDGFLNVDELLGAIGDQTALVFVSHVGFTTGERIPDELLRAVGDRADRHGALFCIDGYHAAGTMPIDVVDLGCDLYFGGLLKEASGSSGNAYLYVRDGLELRPRLSGWFGDADPFDFGYRPVDHPRVRRRFLGGTTAVASLYHAVEGVRLLLEAGLQEVRDYALALGRIALERATAANLPLRSPEQIERRSAMVILEVEQADRLAGWLKDRHVYTDSRRGRYLRLAPFVWNTADEVEEAFDVITAALETGEHAAWQGAPQAGPVT